jgi:hypothetical protein
MRDQSFEILSLTSSKLLKLNLVNLLAVPHTGAGTVWGLGPALAREQERARVLGQGLE